MPRPALTFRPGSVIASQASAVTSDDAHPGVMGPPPPYNALARIPGLRRVERVLAARGAGLDDVVEIEAQAVVLA